jgi:hypothetical protein
MSKQVKKTNSPFSNVKPEEIPLSKIEGVGGSPFSDLISSVKARQIAKYKDKSIDQYEECQEKGTYLEMKPIESGLLAFESGDIMVPLEYTIYHDGQFDQPPVVYLSHIYEDKLDLHGQPQPHRAFDIFNMQEFLMAGLQQSFRNYLKEVHFEENSVAFSLMRGVSEEVTNYIESTHAIQWFVLPSTDAVAAFKTATHIPDAKELLNEFQELVTGKEGGFGDYLRKELESVAARRGFVEACQRIVIVSRISQTFQATVSIASLADEKERAHLGVVKREVCDILPLDLVEPAIGIDPYARDARPNIKQERSKFLEQCKEHEVVLRRESKERVKVIKQEREREEEHERKMKSTLGGRVKLALGMGKYKP